MEGFGINFGYLLVQCISVLVLIAILAIPTYIVFRSVISSRRKLSDSEQKVLDVYNQLPEDEKNGVLEDMKQKMDDGQN